MATKEEIDALKDAVVEAAKGMQVCHVSPGLSDALKNLKAVQGGLPSEEQMDERGMVLWKRFGGATGYCRMTQGHWIDCLTALRAEMRNRDGVLELNDATYRVAGVWIEELESRL